MTPAIILGTIFFIIIIFSASVGLYKAIIHLKENDADGLPVLVIVLILVYSLLMLVFIKYILYTFK